MSLIQDDPNEVTLKPNITAINNDNLASHTENTSYIDRRALITHVRGRSWTLKSYFSQAIGKDDALRPYMAEATPIHQQYVEIKHLEVKVESTLSVNQDQTSKQFTAEGAAYVVGVFIPNAGDEFIVDIGDGRDGLFTVTECNRSQMFKDSVYRITYQLQKYVTPKVLEDLKAKTQKVLHYRREYLDYGTNPLLEDEVIQWVRSLEETSASMQDYYYKTYYSHEFATFLVPGQSGPTYDPFMTEFVLGSFMASESPKFSKVRRLNVKEDVMYFNETLFDAIQRRERFVLREGIRQVGLVSAGAFDYNPDFHSVRYSGVDYVVYPKGAVVNVDQQLLARIKPITKEKFDERSFTGGLPLPPTQVDIPVITGQTQDPETGIVTPSVITETRSLIHPVQIDDYYVFSEHFYDRTDGQSMLELEVQNFIDHKRTNAKLLNQFVLDWRNWGVLERFYYTPIVLFLIHANLRGL